MTRGVRSRIFHEPGASDSRHRDLFPLPSLKEDSGVRGSVSHAVRRRIHRRNFNVKRVNLAISSLNSLFYGGEGRFKPWCADDLSSLPHCQRESLGAIIQSIKAFGSPPANASRSGALQALRTISDGYSDPEPGVGSVCSMVLHQLSLPSGGVAGVDLASALDEPLRSIVCNFEDWMMVEGDRWAEVADIAGSVRTYNDPSLHDHVKYLKFLKHLHQCGILGLVDHCRGRVGAFTVTKKPKFVDGNRIDRQRLILDCRAVNYLFKDPPHTRLGSLAALTELELPCDEKMFIAGADIQDCFYAAKLPSGMEECFCLHRDLTRQEAADVFGDDFSGFSHLERCIPCITVLPMGFSWSFYIIQQLHEQASLRALGITNDQLIKDGNPPPSFGKGGVLAMPYCDNVHCIATSREEADRGKGLIKDELESMGFSLHEEESASSYFQTLGGIVDGEAGVVAPTRNRAWNCILAFEHLLDNKVSCKLVQQLIGHSIVIFVLNRAGMSIFRHLYDFVQSDCAPRKLTACEQDEVKVFIGLVPLLYGNMRLEWSSTVTVTDASPIGYGLCERELDASQVGEMGRWQERWRFKHLDPESWKPRERIQGRDVLNDLRTARAFPCFPNLDSLYQVDGNFPEVPLDVMKADKWKTVLMGRWRDTTEHITIKEGRALVIAARRLTRNSRSRGKRHLFFVDNLALAMSSCKGRASNYSMLRIMQQLGALSLAGGFVIRLRWVASEFNPADGPSRGQVRPGTYQAPSSQADGRASFFTKSSRSEPESECSEESGQAETELPTHESDREESDRKEKGDQAARVFEEASSQKSFGKPTGRSAGDRQAGEIKQVDSVGEAIGECKYRGAVQKLLSEVSEFLPGTRSRFATISKHRCKPERFHGCVVLRGEAHERRGEDLSERGVPSQLPQRKACQGPKSSAWVAQRMPARESNSSAEAGGLWHVHDSVRHGSQTPCPEAHLGLRHIHEAGRELGPAQETLGQAGFQCWTPVSLVCGGDQRFRRVAARQSGGVRQQCPTKQQGAEMDWSSPPCSHQDSSQQRFKDFPIHCEGVWERIHQGGRAAGTQRATPLPTSSWRSSRRSELEGERSPGRQSQGPVADGSIRPPLHQGGKDSANLEPALTTKHGVLSLVTPKPRESVSRSPRRKDELDPVLTDVFTCRSKPHTFALEIFAGIARISSALCKSGITTFPVDICMFPDHDVLHKHIEYRISNWIRAGRISFVWIGMPCTTFSRARKHDGLGPGPLRDSMHLWGLNCLNRRDRKKLGIGNALFHFTMRILRLCEHFAIPYALENPRTSMLWEMKPLRTFCDQFYPHWCHFDFCQFGERWKKPTSILYNFLDLSPVNKQCDTHYGFCSRTSRPHVRLAGTDHDGVFLTLRAQPYPDALAVLVSQQVARALQG